MPNDRERCIAAGANEYVSKPMDMKQLLKIIGDMLPKQTHERSM